MKQQQEWYTEYDQEVWVGRNRETIARLSEWAQAVKARGNQFASDLCTALAPLTKLFDADIGDTDGDYL